MDRFGDPPESSDCSNHSTTDKDSEEVSDTDSRHAGRSDSSSHGEVSRSDGARSEATAMSQPSVRPRSYVQAPPSGSSVLAPSRLGNPFARVAPPVVRSSADSSAEHRSGAVLAPSRLGGTSGAVSSSGRSVLRPPALSVPAASLKTPETNGLANSTFTLHPPKFNNPFFAAKPAPESEDSSSDTPEGAATDSRRPADAPGAASATPAGATVLPPSEPVTSTSGSNGFSLMNPAAQNRSEDSSEATSSSPGFVFGQNLEERVTNAATADSAVTTGGEGEAREGPPPTKADGAEAAGEAEEAAAPDAEAGAEAAAGATPPSSGLSLRESAEVYEKQRATKRKYEQVEVVTGEEDESNVLQINCKLYAFNAVTCWWQERGRGLLRLNDRRQEAGPMHSRLVFRTQGSLRLVLNTKLWSGMSVEKPSDKDVRVTAMDNEQVKVFLIKSSAKDAELLYNALQCRLSTLKAEGATGDDAETEAKKSRPQEGNTAEG